jgi:hypothetical protein
MTHDCAGGESFPLTQEFMATMLGVHRPSVNIAMGILDKAALIRHEGGRLHMLDREGLESIVCECDGDLQERSAHLNETAGNGLAAERAAVRSA